MASNRRTNLHTLCMRRELKGSFTGRKRTIVVMFDPTQHVSMVANKANMILGDII